MVEDIEPAADGKAHRIAVIAGDASGSLARTGLSITPSELSAAFPDTDGHWANAAVSFLKASGVTTGDDPVDIGVEAAPLDRIQADFMQVTVPTGSRLNGVTVQELRLPQLAVVATIIREGAALPVDGATRIRAGDELLIVTPSRERQKVEERFRRVSASGRLASWLDR